MIISHKSQGRENPLEKPEADVLNPNHTAGLYPGSGYRTKNNASLSKPVECQMPEQLQGVNLRELEMGSSELRELSEMKQTKSSSELLAH